MGRELVDRYPVFSRALDEAEECLAVMGATWGVREELLRDEDGSRLDDPAFSFPSTIILQLALIRLLSSWGIEPSATTGHSSGEIAAAYTAGILSFDEAIAIAYHRGRITSQAIASGRLSGVMAALGIGPDEAAGLIKGLSCVMACVNSPSNVTIAGDDMAMEEMEKMARDRSLFFRRLKIPAAYHSPAMAPLAEEYETALRPYLKPSPDGQGRPRIRIASPVTAQLVKTRDELRSPKHWVRNMTDPVRFSRALDLAITTKTVTTVDAIIEIGPHGALGSAISQLLRAQKLDVRIDSCLSRGKHAVQTMLELAGRLHCQGHPIHLQAVNFPDGRCNRVVSDLPSYSWNHSTSYWVNSRLRTETLLRKHGPHDLLGLRVAGLEDGRLAIWRNRLRVTDLPWLRHHLVQGEVVLPGVALVAMVVEAVRQLEDKTEDGDTRYALTDVHLVSAVLIPDDDGEERGLETQLLLRDGRHFSLHSRIGTGPWTENSRGTITNTPSNMKPSPPPIINKRALTKVDTQHLYTTFSAHGPSPGPSFQNITALAATPGAALGTVTVPNTLAMMPFPHQSVCWVHPTVLDACFQVGWAAVAEPVMKGMGVCITRSWERLEVASSAGLLPGSELEVRARVRVVEQGFRLSLWVHHGQESRPLFRADGVYVQSLSGKPVLTSVDNSLILHPVWQPDISLLPDGHPLEEAEFATLFSHKKTHADILQTDASSTTILQGLTSGATGVGTYDITFAAATQLNPKIRFRPLDLTLDPLTQGFHASSYDLVVVGGDALQEAKSVRHALTLLRAGGMLLVTSPERENSCWASGITAAGFQDVRFFSSASGTMIVATKPETQPSTTPAQHITLINLPNSNPPAPKAWLSHLSQFLTDGIPTRVSTHPLGTLPANTRCIILGQANPNFLSNLDTSQLEALRTTLQLASDTIWITRGSNQTPEAAMVNGLLRTLRLEERVKKFISLDLDPDEDPWTTSVAHAIRSILRLDNHDYEYALRSGRLLVPRLTGTTALNTQLSALKGAPMPEKKLFSTAANARLEPIITSQLSSLVFKHHAESNDQLTDAMIEVEAHAFGLSPRDILVAEGNLNAHSTAFECAGTVRRLGSRVPAEVCAGLRVCGFVQGAWGGHLRTRGEMMVAVPDGMGWETAALVPSYAVALDVLEKVARLEALERVLIRGSFAAVEQAFIIIAQHKGAEVFITASNEEDEQLMRDTFGIPEDHILDSSHPTLWPPSIDLVLNFTPREPSIQLPIPIDRFIQLGFNLTSLLPSSGCCTFTAVDLAQLSLVTPTASLRKAIDFLQQREPDPRLPLTVYSISDCPDAFISLQKVIRSGSRTSKTVVTAASDDPISTFTIPNPLTFPPSASYLIVGGLSGLGLEIAHWMARHGATNLILLSRNATAPKTDPIVKDLNRLGAQTLVLSCDVADKDALTKTITEYQKTAPPIRGIIQAATILHDAFFSQMTASQWQASLRPKVQGTRNLDALFRHPTLDFFIVLSSLTAIVGNMGQANYTAAGAYQDGLIRQRLKAGLPAVSINIGSVPALGSALRKGMASQLDRIGTRYQTRADLVQLVEIAVRNPRHGQMITGIEPWVEAQNLRWRLEPRFACTRIVDSKSTSSKDDDEASSTRGPSLSTVRNRLAGIFDAAEATPLLIDALAAQLASMTALPVADINPDEQLTTYGVDSLVAAELRAVLQVHVSLAVTVFDVTGAGTLRELAVKVGEKMVKESGD
ncbi:hypothetical protein CDD80_5123 [Ophiocordyceps camponoti-rufipedis]|uniref:Uncharacterized protein n=1 Tax=Ophiocordyceps camponoti-rufipedis TaxID=2004952 RepID=A0A2C5YX27_9HYPO|nr:hypothetical protein CDD80_5123 [Ophiocordyceps camponoti-rufipedis]